MRSEGLESKFAQVIPADTARSWHAIAEALPPGLYLGGGTALALRLGHRQSQDLDFFYHRGAVDLDELVEQLQRAGPFAVTERGAGTLNGVFSATKVQFLHADEERATHRLAEPDRVQGIEVAAMADLVAMKLAAIGGRGELRDYYDLMAVEQRTGPPVEQGFGLLIARYRPANEREVVRHTALALGHTDDLEDDQALGASRTEIVAYWRQRAPALASAAARF